MTTREPSAGSTPVISLALPARLDATNAGTVTQALMARLREGGQGQQAQVDASALQSFDSSALATLLALQRQAMERGASLHLHAAPLRLVELARLYGVHELLLPAPAAQPA
ncbi:STAS domain-containing protein [Brachymonas denitrificans]|uniref:Phospholipid transport system transporter-binding protein n=1 Tax=Brachymonas denitrificans DSM 15123 TaxID=1121117 RepID=A0A1H8DET5_9BURK|nr:STAS domain-containing protein [Brachymonas denitrificans]SEN05605.1 phospholipid transport system transporter-binding protein [Brachymonas denitrificans DSM 15123]